MTSTTALTPLRVQDAGDRCEAAAAASSAVANTAGAYTVY